MPTAHAVKFQIESALSSRIPYPFTPAAKASREVMPTGVSVIDELLQGGFPIGAITEMIGTECSGRTTVALSFLAKMTQAERVCAWVDVSDEFSPESAAASGIDLNRLLWVRCGVSCQRKSMVAERRSFALPEKFFSSPAAKKGVHGSGCGSHPRSEIKGLSEGVSGLLSQPSIAPRCAEPTRVARREREAFEPITIRTKQIGNPHSAAKPWARIEQALRVTDLLLQAGGFSSIVFDLGSIAPQHVLRIPISTWFRYRAAAERTQTSIVLLTQHACSKSSAGLVLHLQSRYTESSERTVMTGLQHCVTLSRQRFTELSPKVVPLRKPPQNANARNWQSRTTWAAIR